MKNWVEWKTRVVWVVSAVIASVMPGCARDRGPARVNGFSGSSTLGSDLRQVPRGVTVGPPSLGVDLVRGPEESPPGDAETVRAGYRDPADRPRLYDP